MELFTESFRYDDSIYSNLKVYSNLQLPNLWKTANAFQPQIFQKEYLIPQRLTEPQVQSSPAAVTAGHPRLTH